MPSKQPVDEKKTFTKYHLISSNAITFLFTLVAVSVTMWFTTINMQSDIRAQVREDITATTVKE